VRETPVKNRIYKDKSFIVLKPTSLRDPIGGVIDSTVSEKKETSTQVKVKGTQKTRGTSEVVVPISKYW